MPTWARLDGANTVIEVFTHPTITPAQLYVPLIASQFVPCPDGTIAGATKSGSTWTNPTPPPPSSPVVLYAMLEPATFIGLLQQAGGVTNAQLNAFQADANMGWVRLYLQSLKHGVIYPDATSQGALTTSVLGALQNAAAPGPYLSSAGRAAVLTNWPTL